MRPEIHLVACPEIRNKETYGGRCKMVRRTGERVKDLTCLLLIVLVVQLISIANASSFTNVDVQTAEAVQVAVHTPSGIRPTIGWTIVGNGSLTMTVTVKQSNVGWIGVGVASSNGLGTNLMFGGPLGGGAVIGQFGTVSSPAVQEYTMTGPSTADVVVYDATSVSPNDVEKCVADFCVTQAQVCIGQQLCQTALKCGQQQFTLLNSNASANQTLTEIIAIVTNCTQPLTANAHDPASISALAALLDAGSCVVSSCTTALLQKNSRVASLQTSSLTQTGPVTTLTMSLSARQMGGVFMDPAPTAFLVAWGPVNSPGQTGLAYHGPGNRGFVSVNIDSATFQFQTAPSWVLPHVVLCFIGFGIFYPLAMCLRGLDLHKFSFLPLLLVIIAVTIAAIGSVLVSTLGTEPDSGDPHAILGILSLFMVVAYLLLMMVMPVESGADRNEAWRRAALIGLKQSEIEAEARRECKFAVTLLFKMCEFLTVGVVIGAFVTGNMSIANSVVQQNSAFFALMIIGVVLCAVGSLSSCFLGRCCRKKHVRRATIQESTPNSPAQSSQNPGYAGTVTELESNPADVDMEVIPIFLAWENVTSFAPASRTGADPKQILKNAIGYCAPRTLTAVLGPSGAGKSTLMELLAMRARSPPEPASRIYINGVSAGKFPGLHRLMGYVPQQDVLHEFLTVLETLQFTARMILPEEMSENAKVERLLRVVAQLGLGHVLDTKVGGENIRGLSGGERRRISIALQMLKSPSVLFLDEPTSGLDAHLALRLVKVLRELANEGRTIFATIHQPSAACFELFDRVILLSGGYTVFSGTRTALLNFMKEVNRDVPFQWNPADWLLTVIDFKRDDDRIGQDEQGKTVYKTDDRTEETLRKRGVISKQGLGRASHKFRAATSMSSLALDVSELRDNVRAYYLQVNPAKLRDSPGVIEEIVSFALQRGLNDLDAKLVSRYKVSILPFFKQKDQKNLEPCTWEELTKLITTFASSRYAVELVTNIRNAKGYARTSLARLGPGSNSKFILQFMDNAMDDGSMSPRTKFSGSDEEEEAFSDYGQSFMNQVRLLSRRQLILVWRNPQALRFQALQNILFGILLGALYSNVKFLQSSPFQQSIVMAIILAMVAFVTLSLGTQVAFSERLVLEREMQDAMYSPLAHFVSRLLIGIPVASIVALCLILPAYFWVGLLANGNAFFFFCLVNVAVVFLFDSVVFALTLFVTNVNTAYAIGNFYEAITIFFSGVFLPIYAMPIFFRWIYFLSPFSYAFGAVVVNEFQNSPNAFTIAADGVVIQSSWPNLLVLFAMGVGWRLLGLVGIIRLFRQKRPGSRNWHKNEQEGLGEGFRSPKIKKQNSNEDKFPTLVVRSPKDIGV